MTVSFAETLIMIIAVLIMIAIVFVIILAEKKIEYINLNISFKCN